MIKVLQLHESKDVGMDDMGRARSTAHAVEKLAEDDAHEGGGLPPTPGSFTGSIESCTYSRSYPYQTVYYVLCTDSPSWRRL